MRENYCVYRLKTIELTGASLDWAVAKCEGFYPFTDDISWIIEWEGQYISLPQYSTNWAQGGVIIEREWLDITPWPNESDEDLRWQCVQHDSIDRVAFGPTPLIAAMRCYVMSRLGDEVDIPEGLK